MGNAMMGSLSGYDGRTAPSVGIVDREIQTRIKASEMSVFARRIVPRRMSARCRFRMKRWKEAPNWIESGACKSVPALTPEYV
jgi:hypothetical protein